MAVFRAVMAAAIVVLGACASGGDDPDTGIVIIADAGGGDRIAADGPIGGDPDANTSIDAGTGDGGELDAAMCPFVDAGAPLDMCAAAALEPTNDLCADAIDVTFGVQCGGAFRYGDTTGYLDNLEPPAACTSNFTLDGPDAVYRVNANAGETITATVTPNVGYDTGIYILSECLGSSCLAGMDSALGGGIETAVTTAPSTGTYYVVVDSWSPGVEGCFSLAVTVE